MSPPLRPIPLAPTPTPTPLYTYDSLSPQRQQFESAPAESLSNTPYAYDPLPPYTASPYPTPPYSSSTIHPSPPHPPPHSSALHLHPLLRSSQYGIALTWDLRTDPTLASLRQISVPISYTGPVTTPVPSLVTEHELFEPATAPPVPVLTVSCGIVPSSSTWGTITVTASSLRNNTGDSVTVIDVLNAVRKCMQTALTQTEWDALPKKQQDRVNAVFDLRWRMSETPATTRGDGVLRQDCLLQHTSWAGLELNPVEDNSAVLSLRRPYP